MYVVVGMRGLSWDLKTCFLWSLFLGRGGVLAIGGKTEGGKENAFGVVLDENGGDESLTAETELYL